VGYYDKVTRLGHNHPDLLKHPFNTPQANKLATRLGELARSSGYSISALTLAWWRTKQYPVYPIIGSRTPDQLSDSYQSMEVSEDTLSQLVDIE